MAENIPVRTRRKPAPNTNPVRAVVVPKAPKTLTKEARAMWDQIVCDWALGPDALAILRGGLEQWDSYQVCRAEVAASGPTFTSDAGMVRQHPAAKLALDSFAAFRQAMRQLGLSPEEA